MRLQSTPAVNVNLFRGFVVRNESEKGEVELRVFNDFAKAENIGLVPGSATKGDADSGEPDICCETRKGKVYFELAEACAPEFAAEITRSLKSRETVAVWGSDVSVETVKKKLKKTYSVSQPIELLLYTAGRTALPDDIISAQVSPILSDGIGPFRRVWLFGEGVQLLADIS